ncbi:MAG: hypothetical protein ACYDB4_17765 [Candidatus Dormibacteraceae bacterium]
MPDEAADSDVKNATLADLAKVAKQRAATMESIANSPAAKLAGEAIERQADFAKFARSPG